MCDKAFDLAPARLTVDLNAVEQNWRLMDQLSGGARTAAAVKADAYGLGATHVAPRLAKAGCRDFFVATADEGVALRSLLPDARIFVLSGLWNGLEALFLNAQLIPVANSVEQLEFTLSVPLIEGYALFVDTGMRRLGLSPDEAIGFLNSGQPKPRLLISHLACADTPAHKMNRQQLESFQALAANFSDIESSLSSSAGILLGADYRFSMTRPGIALYGGQPTKSTPLALKNVVTVETRVLQTRNVKQGDAISYGSTHVCQRDGRMAVLAAGYADGIHRALSGDGTKLRDVVKQGGQTYFNGYFMPVIGRITMDLLMIDITDVELQPGDYVELIGENISLESAAEAAGTISYELLTSLGQRLSRRYI